MEAVTGIIIKFPMKEENGKKLLLKIKLIL